MQSATLLFFAFISTPSLRLIPDTVLIPPLTRERERERGERTSVSLNFWATRACLNATEASWQLPHEAHAAAPAGDVATRRAMNSIKIKANRKTQTKHKNLTSQKSNREITNKPLEIVVCLFGMWHAMQMS